MNYRMSENNPKVTISVVVPTYNRQEELNRALLSIEKQTRKPDEIIVVDDFSDPPLEIPARSSVPIKLFRLTKNSGPYVARNYAIKRAMGDLIAFLDSDDEWLPEKLERQLRQITNADRFFSFTDGIVKKKGKLNSSMSYFTLSKPKENSAYFGIFDTRSSFIANSSVVISKSLLLSRSCFVKDLIGSDFRMWAEVLIFEPDVEVVIVYEKLFNLYITSGSVSSNFDRKQNHLLRHLAVLYASSNKDVGKIIISKTARVLLSILLRSGSLKFFENKNKYANYVGYWALIIAAPLFIFQTLHYLIFLKSR